MGFTYLGYSQNRSGNNINARRKLIIVGDTINNTTQVNSEDTTVVTLDYLKNIASDKMDLLFDYESTDSLLNNQSSQIKGQIYQVEGTFYKYEGTPTGALSDYTVIGATTASVLGLANLYFTNDSSTIDSSYYQISYDHDTTEFQYDVSVTSSTSPLYFQTYLFEEPIGTNVIPVRDLDCYTLFRNFQ